MKIRMSEFDKISDADLRSILNVKKETRSGQYIIDFCPFCHKSEHFYINRHTQKWDCKKCGETGGIRKLLRHLDKTYLLGAPTVEKVEKIKSIRVLRDEEKVEGGNIEIATVPSIKMPAGFKVFSKPTKYLNQRHIDIDDIRHWGFGYTNIVSKYINYVLVPITEDGDIKGFVGRYSAFKVPDDVLRYSNSLHTDFANLLFGYDDIVKDKTDTVIITEGLFDAIAVTKQLGLFSDNTVRAVCTFGKKISKQQINKLLVKNVRKVILLYDYDALKEIKHYALLLNDYFVTRVAVALGKKDIDVCTTSEVFEVFNNVMTVTDFYMSIAAKIKK